MAKLAVLGCFENLDPFFSLFYSCEKWPSIFIKKVVIRAFAATRKLKIQEWSILSVFFLLLILLEAFVFLIRFLYLQYLMDNRAHEKSIQVSLFILALELFGESSNLSFIYSMRKTSKEYLSITKFLWMLQK